MEISTKPFIKEYNKIGSSDLGYITPIQGLPFEIKKGLLDVLLAA